MIFHCHSIYLSLYNSNTVRSIKYNTSNQNNCDWPHQHYLSMSDKYCYSFNAQDHKNSQNLKIMIMIEIKSEKDVHFTINAWKASFVAVPIA